MFKKYNKFFLLLAVILATDLNCTSEGLLALRRSSLDLNNLVKRNESYKLKKILVILKNLFVNIDETDCWPIEEELYKEPSKLAKLIDENEENILKMVDEVWNKK